MQRQYLRIFLNVLLLMFFLFQVAGFVPLAFIDQLENLAYDYRLVLTMPNTVDKRIIIVDIDEKSLAEVGRWPWGRNHVARLLDELFNYYQVAIVGFDVVFAEPDESSGLKILEKLADGEFTDIPEFRKRVEDLRQTLDFDQLFADSLSGKPVIMGYYFNTSGEGAGTLRSGVLPAPVLARDDFRGKRIDIPEAIGYGANLQLFQNSALGGGHFNPSIDADGIVRRIPLLYEYEGRYYEALSLAMVRAIHNVGRIEPVFVESDMLSKADYSGLEWIRLGHLKIPVDEHVQVLIPYRGRQQSFNYVSASDVLHGRLEPAVLKDAVVLVGTSAPGLFDLRATPMQNKYPGVEIHANLIAGLLDQVIKERPPYTAGAEFVLMLLSGLILSILIPCVSPLWANIIFAIITVLLIVFNLSMWQFANLVLPVASLLVMLLGMYLLNMTFGFFVERRGKRQITGLFGQYIPPELVDELSANPEACTMDAENREMTVLFSDVRGFTTLSEGLSPKDLSRLMNEFLTPMTRIIHQNRGTIDKYMGDAIMAFWGAPLEDAGHARHALDTGMAMLESLNALREEFRARGWPEIRIGIGINTGEMSVGNMGSEFRMAYTVMGDAVNLGSRLEGLTKVYGVGMIVSESTRTAVPDYTYRELDRVRVKGKDEPVTIYEPVALVTEITKSELDEIKLYKLALKYYLDQNWDMAELQLLNLQKQFPARKLYQVYVERAQEFRVNPPAAHWDGVYTHTSK
ncbi:MAG: guanylate cyclase [Gammaproteobacteria bacterium RBG_16_51_14]|nr:MAG: guanylate cyclase [Gammaproteobacteria bacterium RBG_16_51_14]